MTDFVAELGSRALFPKLSARVYAAHAAISPHSLAVREAILAVTDDYAEHGVGAVGGWFQAREGLRQRLATLLGAEADEVAFVRNTTEGVVAIAMGLPWRRDDRVVLYTGEFPTNVTPWLSAAEAHGLVPVFLPSSDFTDTTRALERLEDTLREGARLVAVSAVSFQTGRRVPLKAMSDLCHAHGAVLFVDAIQALGAVPINVHDSGIDFLAAGGHKWLMGPEGTGVLYAARDQAAQLVPRVAGWLSHEEPLDFLFGGEGLLRYDKPLKRDISFVEAGVPNALGFAALDASVSLLLQLGVETIHQHINQWNDALEVGLIERGFESLRASDADARSGILSVIAPDPGATVGVHDALNAHGISCNVPDGKLRFAPHWPNRVDEVPVVLEAIDALMGTR